MATVKLTFTLDVLDEQALRLAVSEMLANDGAPEEVVQRAVSTDPIGELAELGLNYSVNWDELGLLVKSTESECEGVKSSAIQTIEFSSKGTTDPS